MSYHLIVPVVVLAFGAGCIAASPTPGQSIASFVEDGRDYALVSVNGQPPTRPLDLTIFEVTAFGRPAFKICGECMCITGVFTADYPSLGIRPTSASPTFACEDATTTIEADSAAPFLAMTRADVSEGQIVVADDDGQTMVFR
mgnify:CR=1 FL=1